ncbi:MAG: FAD binding domain-containing protein [Spirochaetales bacterium]|nr:FAD binding domain-containing protein [Spirochaetales bacterium]
MEELAWYFPAELEEIPQLLRKGCIIHSGGTNLLKGGLLRAGSSNDTDSTGTETRQAAGIADISKISELKIFKHDNGKIIIGSGLTYSETAESMSGLNPEHILVKALKNAASNALRNRITLGGSVAAFPPWSDLAGPLIALNADIYFITADSPEEKTVTAEELLKTPSRRKGIFITKVGFKNVPCKSWYYRDVRTRFDYPKFTITILAVRQAPGLSGAGEVGAGISGVPGLADNSHSVRIVITGVKGRFVREHALEEKARELADEKIEVAELKSLIDRGLTARFQKKAETGGDYLKHVASVELRRGLEKLIRSLK